MTQTEIERERYEARRKWQLDYTSGLNQARREGLEEGLEKGLEKGREEGREKGREEGLKFGVIGTIHFSERVLGRAQTPSEDLMRLSVEDLKHLSDRLQEDVTARLGTS